MFIDSSYLKRITKHENYYSIVDEDFESSIAFSNEDGFLEELNEEGEYFKDDRILISCYYLVNTNILVPAEDLVSDIDRKIVGRDHCYNLDCLIGFVSEEFIELNPQEQLLLLAQNLRSRSQ